MKFKKVLPSVIVASLIAGVGFAHGATSVSKQSVTSPGIPSPETTSSPDADMKSQSHLPKDKVANRIARVKEDIADDRQDLRKDQKLLARIRTESKDKVADRTARLKEDIADDRQDLRKDQKLLARIRTEPKDKVADRTARLKEDIADDRQDLRKDQKLLARIRTESKDKVADRIARVREDIADDRQDLRKDRKLLARSGRDFDHQDRESPEASLHHDGEDHNRGLARADFEQDTHREAVREIEKASHIRVARLYSPKHRAGYHARMHRHSR